MTPIKVDRFSLGIRLTNGHLAWTSILRLPRCKSIIHIWYESAWNSTGSSALFNNRTDTVYTNVILYISLKYIFEILIHYNKFYGKTSQATCGRKLPEKYRLQRQIRLHSLLDVDMVQPHPHVRKKSPSSCQSNFEFIKWKNQVIIEQTWS